LYKAAKRYDSVKQVKFATYANVCVKNYLTSFFRKYGGEEASVSLDDIPESELSKSDDYNFLRDFENIFEVLTSFERQVFMMYIERKSYKHIAKILNKSVKSIDNAVCRVKNKLKPYAKSLMD
jgi:RNA polymerase sporulation-specific sigma factor